MAADLTAGIHLAADRAVVALGHDGGARVVPNAVGSLHTPAAVWVDQRGRLRVGAEARDRALAGEDSRAAMDLLARLEQGDEGALELGDGRRMQAPELVAALLKSLRTDVRTNTGSELMSAVLAVPTGASPDIREGLVGATRLAGLESVEMVEEAVAAAYGAGLAGDGARPSESRHGAWLVCQAEDVAFHAAVVRAGDGEVAVSAYASCGSVNGEALTERLARTGVQAVLNARNLRWDDLGAAARARLLYRVDDAKRDVWRTGEAAEVFLEALHPGTGGDPFEVDFELTVAGVDEAARQGFEDAVETCRGALDRASLSGEAIEEIVLVGSCAGDPGLQKALEGALGRAVSVDADPLTVAARGAALMAARRAGVDVPSDDRDGPAPAASAAGGPDPVRTAEVVAPPDPTEEPETTPAPVAEQRTPVDPARLQRLRTDVRWQRRRLLALHERVAMASESERTPLATALADLVRRRLYERVDALFVEARAGSGDAADDLTGAIEALDTALTRLEELD